MKSHFDDVLTFLQVVEAGSITAAAARLNLSKSVVSKRIGDLESRLGTELFRRSTRRVVPTDRGAAFYEKMRALVAEPAGHGRTEAERRSNEAHGIAFLNRAGERADACGRYRQAGWGAWRQGCS